MGPTVGREERVLASAKRVPHADEPRGCRAAAQPDRHSRIVSKYERGERQVSQEEVSETGFPGSGVRGFEARRGLEAGRGKRDDLGGRVDGLRRDRDERAVRERRGVRGWSGAAAAEGGSPGEGTVPTRTRARAGWLASGATAGGRRDSEGGMPRGSKNRLRGPRVASRVEESPRR